MTSHELAQLLLNGPNLPVAVFDSSYGIETISPVLEIQEKHIEGSNITILQLMPDPDVAYYYY